MENYDVIIVGAGIAGTGLAYNLKKENYRGSVLVIDKKGVGANAAYGYRNTTSEVVKEYNFPYEHVYKGVKVGSEDKTYFTLNKKFYFLNYKKICKHLLKKSDAEYKKEKALKLNNEVLKTNEKKYKFKILVDCSGSNFFVKKIYNQIIPFRYFIGRVRTLKNKLKNTNYFYYQFSDSGFIEELYPLKDKTLQGDWQYTKNTDFNLINPEEKTLYKSIDKPKIIKQKTAIVPATPIFPLTYKNIVFLGDSFGNATTSSAEGIRTILDSSKMLTKAIKENNLHSYEKAWKRKYLNAYLKYLVIKLDTYTDNKFLQKIKKTPPRVKLFPIVKKYLKFFEKNLMCNPSIKVPSEIKKQYPKRKKIFLLYYYLYLKLKYAHML